MCFKSGFFLHFFPLLVLDTFELSLLFVIKMDPSPAKSGPESLEPDLPAITLTTFAGTTFNVPEKHRVSLLGVNCWLDLILFSLVWIM